MQKLTQFLRARPVAASSLAALVTTTGVTAFVGVAQSGRWNTNWDGLESDDRGTRKARNIIMIRHGQYVGAKDDKDRVLTAAGREQARITGQRLKAMNLPLKRITTSTMTRADETSRIIAKELGNNIPIDNIELIREGAPWVPEPLGARDPVKYQQDVDNCRPRMDKFFKSYFHRPPKTLEEDTWEVVVAHANVIRYFTMRLLQLPPEAWLRTSIANCGMTWVVIRTHGSVSLRVFGCHGHLPWDLVTFS